MGKRPTAPSWQENTRCHFFLGRHGRAECGPGTPRSTCQGGKWGERFRSEGQKGYDGEGGWHWPCNLDHSWSREGGGSMAGASGDGDGEGRWQVRGGEKVGAGWCLVRVSRTGKVPWQPVVLGEPRGDGDGGGTWAGESWGTLAGQLRLSYAKGRSSGAVLSLSITHILHASSCLRDAQAGWLGVSETQRHRQEGSGGSWSRDKHYFPQHRPACTAPPRAPRHPTAYKAHRKVLLAPESQSCGGRERGGGAGGGKQGWRASLLLGAAWQAGRLLPLFFLHLGHRRGTTGSSAG